jgi:hypothetical protein
MASGQVSNVITEKILSWLLAKRDPAAQRDPVTGRFCLPYSRPYQWMVLVMFLLATGFLVLGIAGTLDDPKALLIVSSIFGLLWIGMVAALYDVKLVTIDVSDDGIRRKGPFGSEIHLSWQEIDRMGYSEAWKWFYFRAPGAGTIRVSVYRNGLETLAATAAARLQGRPVEANVTVLRERTARPF